MGAIVVVQHESLDPCNVSSCGALVSGGEVRHFNVVTPGHFSSLNKHCA